MQIGGGSPLFIHGLKGGGGTEKYSNVLPAVELHCRRRLLLK